MSENPTFAEQVESRFTSLEDQLDKLRPKKWFEVLGPALVAGVIAGTGIFVQHRHSSEERARLSMKDQNDRALVELQTGENRKLAKEADYLDRQQNMIGTLMGAENLDEITLAYTLFSSSTPPSEYAKQWHALLGTVVQHLADRIEQEENPYAILRASVAIERTRKEIRELVEKSDHDRIFAGYDAEEIVSTIRSADAKIDALKALDKEQQDAWKKDRGNALEVLLRACEAGVAQACGRAGKAYYMGWNANAKVDHPEAKRLYQQACTRGSYYYCGEFRAMDAQK